MFDNHVCLLALLLRKSCTPVPLACLAKRFRCLRRRSLVAAVVDPLSSLRQPAAPFKDAVSGVPGCGSVSLKPHILQAICGRGAHRSDHAGILLSGGPRRGGLLGGDIPRRCRNATGAAATGLRPRKTWLVLLREAGLQLPCSGVLDCEPLYVLSGGVDDKELHIGKINLEVVGSSIDRRASFQEGWGYELVCLAAHQDGLVRLAAHRAPNELIRLAALFQQGLVRLAAQRAPNELISPAALCQGGLVRLAAHRAANDVIGIAALFQGGLVRLAALSQEGLVRLAALLQEGFVRLAALLHEERVLLAALLQEGLVRLAVLLQEGFGADLRVLRRHMGSVSLRCVEAILVAAGSSNDCRAVEH